MTLTSQTSLNKFLRNQLETVYERIDQAAARVGKQRKDITVIAVTKSEPTQLIRDLIDLGVSDFGENRHQEAALKMSELIDLDLRMHFIGQLQSKKAKQVRAYAHTIHSVDRLSLVRELSSNESVIEVFVQINLTNNPQRGGVSFEHLEPLVENILESPGLKLRGVMAVAPLGGDPKESFQQVVYTSERVQKIYSEASAISLGMSADFEQAIEYGATHLRLGRIITGQNA